jgi:hypothetical protein
MVEKIRSESIETRGFSYAKMRLASSTSSKRDGLRRREF